MTDRSKGSQISVTPKVLFYARPTPEVGLAAAVRFVCRSDVRGFSRQLCWSVATITNVLTENLGRQRFGVDWVVIGRRLV